MIIECYMGQLLKSSNDLMPWKTQEDKELYIKDGLITNSNAWADYHGRKKLAEKIWIWKI